MSNPPTESQQQPKSNIQRSHSKKGPLPRPPSNPGNIANNSTPAPVPPAKTSPKTPPKVPPKVPVRTSPKGATIPKDSRADNSEAVNEDSREDSMESSEEGNTIPTFNSSSGQNTTSALLSVPVRTRLGKHGSVSITSAIFLKPPPPPPRTSKPSRSNPTSNFTPSSPLSSTPSKPPPSNPPPSPPSNAVPNSFSTPNLAQSSQVSVKSEQENNVSSSKSNPSMNGTGNPPKPPPRMNKPLAQSSANLKMPRASIPSNRPSNPKAAPASSSGTLRLKRQGSVNVTSSPSSSSEQSTRNYSSPSNESHRSRPKKNTSAFSRRARTLWEAEKEEELADILAQRLEVARKRDEEILQERLKKIPLMIPEEFPCQSLERFTLKTILNLLDTEECYTFPGLFHKPGKPAETKKLQKEIQKLWEDIDKTKAKEMERFLWFKNQEIQQQQHQQQTQPKSKKDKKKEKEPEPVIKTKDFLALADLLLEVLKTQKEPPTAEVYEELLIADEIENPITKAVYIRDVLKEMKEDHFVVLYMMCAYLAKLSQKEYSAKNEMSLDEIGKIFGPLLIADKQDFFNAQQNLELPQRGKPDIANKLLVFIVQHYKLIFCYDGM